LFRKAGFRLLLERPCAPYFRRQTSAASPIGRHSSQAPDTERDPMTQSSNFRPSLRFPLAAIGLAVGVLLVAPPAVRAQDDVQALSEKVDRLQQQLSDLERQVYNGQAPAGGGAQPTGDVAANQEVRIQQLEGQVSNLTGQIEELRNSIQQLSTRIDKMSQDTDFRLNALEHGQTGGASPAGNAGAAVGAAGAAAGAAGAQAGGTQGAGQQLQPLQTMNPAINPSQTLQQSSLQPRTLGTLTQSQLQSANVQPAPGAAATAAAQAGSAKLPPLPGDTAEGQYEYAFNLLRQAKYDDAEKGFRSFLAQHPSDYLSGNAQYWLGETYYVRGRYQDAAVTFAEGYQKYPNSSKAPDNLLKLGMALGQLGKTADACVAFTELTKKFPSAPDSVATRLREEKRRYACR
jgi:tol-pal system protein YbgF